MNPKAAKTLYKEVAKELNIEEEFLRDVVETYWKMIRNLLSTLDYPNIKVTGLGMFRVKVKALEKHRTELEAKLRMITPNTFQKMAMVKDYEEQFSRVLHMEEMILKEHDKREAKKKLRYGENYMEKQMAYPRRSSKQDIQEEQSGAGIHKENDDLQSLPPFEQGQ